ncbi:MAG: folylpolyglutamate synthase/dihydrofolate synthase family protein [Brevundimonas sp.]|uniref:bifunctional folylpolyglutamate synthase/dihydrofolate synthase n=1 Tax=Brevundimonas sp. TaxID=1871086 RepID=UPI002AB95109|nr:folylpolyglutamate synthase/dihydrofolate synthase family protein [Brevundimonas sp.]MDZ4108832.1 folylpolyglutamate synthase/dihydrofolate synthase family protein [Brevundimonas sp.]
MDPISARLRARHPQRIDLSLERMTALCAALGDPQLDLPPVVHVAGTNGKGSTVAFLRAMAEAAGLKVHVYSSPHLVRFNERIRLAGSLISDAALEAILDRIEAIPGEATVFESTTAAAFVAMSEVPADLALIEVGLGGSLDATNVLPVPQLAVITPVDHDHAEFLGTDLAGIAGEKAGILKRGGRAVVARQPEVARDVIGRVAARNGVALSVMGEDIDAFFEHGRLIFQGADRLLDLPLPNLSGPHQIDNAGLAVAAALDLGLTVDAIEAGLTSAVWPARMQRLKAGPYGLKAEAAGAELWLDGGHNPHAGRALSEALLERQRRDPRPMALIVGLLASKDAGGFFQTLRLLEAPVITVDFEGAAVPAEALAAVARGQGLGAMPADSVDEAVRRALDLGAGRIVICGSLYLAGEVLGASEDTWPV